MRELEEKFFKENKKSVLDKYKQQVLKDFLKYEKELKTAIFEALEQISYDLPQEDEVAYLEFAPLQIGFLNQKYEVSLTAYGKKWYTQPLAYTYFKIDYLFEELELIKEQWRQDIKKYLGKIRASSIDYYILKELNTYNDYFTYFTIRWLRQWDEEPSFKRLKKSKKLQVLWGNYKDLKQLVYSWEEQNKTEEMFKEKITENTAHNLIFSWWKNLEAKEISIDEKDISCINLKHSYLQYICFNHCTAVASNLKKARLSKIYFQNCNLQNSDFTEAMLQEVIFENCDLQQANFKDTHFNEVILINGNNIRKINQE